MTEIVILECQSLCKQFVVGTETIDVLRDINLQICKGESVAIIGTSGAGKTTLLTLLGGLDTPSSGKVLITGQDIHGIDEKKRTQLRNQQLGFVYQFHHLLQEFTALENVQLPPMLSGMQDKEAAELAEQVLTQVGLGHRLHHKPSELSGGERQRVAIARALVNKPACILLDEPTGNLDQHNSEVIYELLAELNRELLVSFILVTHDQKMAQKMQRIIVIEKGTLVDN